MDFLNKTMETLSIIGMILMFIGFASAALAAVLYVLSLSAVAGTIISKKLEQQMTRQTNTLNKENQSQMVY